MKSLENQKICYLSLGIVSSHLTLLMHKEKSRHFSHSRVNQLRVTKNCHIYVFNSLVKNLINLFE